MNRINESPQGMKDSMIEYWSNLLNVYKEALNRVKLTLRYYNNLHLVESAKLKEKQSNEENSTQDRWLIEYVTLSFNNNYHLFNKKFLKCINKIQQEIDKIKVLLSRTKFKATFNFVNRYNQSVRYLNKIIEFVNANEYKFDNIVFNKATFLKPLEYIYQRQENPQNE